MPRKAKPKVPGFTSHPQNTAVAPPTGLPYGEHQALKTAMASAPMGQALPTPTPPALPGSPTQPPTPGDIAQAMPFPQLGDLTGPTERPDEPVQAGIPSGPGPGPEALTSVGAPMFDRGFGDTSVSDGLRLVASATGSPAAAQLAAQLGTRPY